MPERWRDLLEVIVFIAVVALIWIAVPVQAQGVDGSTCRRSTIANGTCHLQALAN
jgi:hypothetical protein